ncbi:hypothetical protein EYZ11_005633 [Aspergillus tanneri]|uniref:Cytochrome P450-dit2 n=1 Tax=Aspergillus tanneri TaxID=1220188 RepID=A0A4S3JND4_9EURO|nr:hypothetical protein EYZ11_005633 [Aspergillus tanneri]
MIIQISLLLTAVLLLQSIVTRSKAHNALLSVPLYQTLYDCWQGSGPIAIYNLRQRPLLERHGGAIYTWNAGRWTLLVTNPEYLSRIFRNESIIAKGGFYRKTPHGIFARLFGPNIITSSGTVWKNLTLIIKPALQRSVDVSFMIRHSTKLVSRVLECQAEKPPGRGVNIDPLVENWSVDICGEYFLDLNFAALETGFSRVGNAFQRLFGKLSGPFYAAFPLLERICKLLPSRRRAVALVTDFEDTLLNAVENHQIPCKDSSASSSRPDKLIHRLQQAHRTGQISDLLYRSNLKILFIAGHENVKSVLTSAMWELGRHTHMQELLRQEILSSLAPRSPPSPETLKTLPYLNAVIYETLRLYPPLSQLTNRVALQPFPLDDTLTVAQGTWVGWNAYGVHTDPQNWGAAAHDFQPDRWGHDIHAIRDKTMLGDGVRAAATSGWAC